LFSGVIIGIYFHKFTSFTTNTLKRERKGRDNWKMKRELQRIGMESGREREMVGLKKLKVQPSNGCDLLNRNDRVWVWTFSLLSITVLQFGAMCACSPAIPSEFRKPENL
jgi:hypothetical protein